MDNNRDDLSKLAAIWILACNDEDSILTYDGIVDRLGISKVEVKNLIANYRELFRLGAQEEVVERLKEKFRKLNKDKLPNWLREQSEGERAKSIDAIDSSNVFRSQFRAASNAPRSPIAITEWGLNHIDSLRRANGERKDRVFKMWQSALTLISILVAFGSMLVSYRIAKETIQTQREMVYFQTTLNPKQENYMRFMSALYDAYEAGIAKNGEDLLINLKELNSAYLMLEPYITANGYKEDMKMTSEFSLFCDSLYRGALANDAYAANRYTNFRFYFRRRLLMELFQHHSDKRPE